MSLAKTPDTTSPAAAREDFDEALTQAQTINAIFDRLSDASMGEPPETGASLYSWLSAELKARLERIEVADMTMGRARA